MNEAKWKELLSDGAFVKELEKMENPEEVRDALNAKGAEITVDEVKAIAKSLSQQTEGELDEDALEDVAGGMTEDQMRTLLERPDLPAGIRKTLEWNLRVRM